MPLFPMSRKVVRHSTAVNKMDKGLDSGVHRACNSTVKLMPAMIPGKIKIEGKTPWKTYIYVVMLKGTTRN